MRHLLGKSGQNGFILSALLLLFFSFFPTVYESMQAERIQKGRELVLEHGWTPDFNLYVSKIRQGWEGRFPVVELYTPEPHRGSLIQLFYAFLGRIAGLIGLSPVWIYHLSRLIFGMLLFLITYWFCVRLFPKSLWALGAFWLTVTTASWPIVNKTDILAGRFTFGGYLSWWTILDPLRRITVLPHLLVGVAVVLVIIMIMFFRHFAFSQSLWKNLSFGVLYGLVGLGLGFLFPPALPISYVIVWSTVLMTWMYDHTSFHGSRLKLSLNCRECQWRVVWAVCYSVISFFSLLYLTNITRVYPWKRLNDINLIEPHPFPLYEFALACGPALVLASIGIFLVLLRRDRKFFAFVAWLLGIFFLMVVIRQIPTQNALRFTQVGHFVPIGILVAYSLRWMSKWGKGLSAGLFGLTVVLGMGHMVQSLYWQIDFIHQRVIAVYPDVPRFPQVMYPWQEFMDAIRWLEKSTPQEAVILSDDTFSSYVPPYSGRRVYCCHANTPMREERLVKIWAFYQGSLKEPAKDWLKRLGITYVVFGQQEKETAAMYGVSDLTKLYPFLAPVYQNSRVSIYGVND